MFKKGQTDDNSTFNKTGTVSPWKQPLEKCGGKTYMKQTGDFRGVSTRSLFVFESEGHFVQILHREREETMAEHKIEKTNKPQK